MSQNCLTNEPTVNLPDDDMWVWRVMEMMMMAGENSWLIHQSSLAILPVVIWEQVGGMDEGVRILPVIIWYTSRDLYHADKILRHGAFGFTSYLKEGVL
jgi:hypothetical protein